MSLNIEDTRVRKEFKSIDELEFGTVFEDYLHNPNRFYIKMQYSGGCTLSAHEEPNEYCVCYSFSQNQIISIDKYRKVVPVDGTLVIKNIER